MFEPQKPTRAYENIVDQIEHDITAGRLQVGDQLPAERELAEQFQVSRVVIREASRHLEALGIVEVRQGSGTYVRSVPTPMLAHSLTLMLKLEEASLLDLYVVRQALELVAAPRAAQYVTPEEMTALRECTEEMAVLIRQGIRSEDDFQALTAKDEQFHHMIAEASHNAPLSTLLSAILPLVMRGRLQIVNRTGGFQRFLERSARENVSDEHTNIVDAIANRDPRAAEHFVYLHLQRSMATYRDLE